MESESWPTGLRSTVDTSRGRGFGDYDFHQTWQLRFELVPDPAGQIFGGRIFQAGNVVEEVVVELIPKGLEGSLKIGKVLNPAAFRVVRAADGDFDFKTMAVEAVAFMPFR